MSSKSNIIVGLDIGTSTVSVVVSEVDQDSKIRVLGVGQAPSLGLRKGVVINIESTVESITKAVNEAESASGVEISSVYTSVGGAHIKSFNSQGVVAVRSKEVTDTDIDRVIEAAKAVAIPEDREILHVLPQDFIIDGQDGIKEPLGMSGVRLETRVHIISGSIASAQNVVKCANRCGLSVKDIVVSALAASEVIVSNEEKDLGVCMLDIGGGTSDLIIFHRGSVKHTAVIPVGGSHVTSDIASGLRSPIISAEEIKIKHGMADSTQIRSDEIVEVPSTGGRAPRVLSTQVLSEIIKPRIEEIFNLVNDEIYRAGCSEFLASGIILSGGGSSLRGIADLAQNYFNLPIRIGIPQDVTGLNIGSRKDLTTALGLVKYATRAKSYFRYNQHESGLFKKLTRKVNEWFGDAEG